jgi:hypothetical protein
MERSAIRDEAVPDFAEPVIGRRFAPTRWLGYDIVIATRVPYKQVTRSAAR